MAIISLSHDSGFRDTSRIPAHDVHTRKVETLLNGTVRLNIQLGPKMSRVIVGPLTCLFSSGGGKSTVYLSFGTIVRITLQVRCEIIKFGKIITIPFVWPEEGTHWSSPAPS
jgi:hypothetical protein